MGRLFGNKESNLNATIRDNISSMDHRREMRRSSSSWNSSKHSSSYLPNQNIADDVGMFLFGFGNY